MMKGLLPVRWPHYAQSSAEVMRICAAQREEGEISDSTLATAENLDVIRTAVQKFAFLLFFHLFCSSIISVTRVRSFHFSSSALIKADCRNGVAL